MERSKITVFIGSQPKIGANGNQQTFAVLELIVFLDTLVIDFKYVHELPNSIRGLPKGVSGLLHRINGPSDAGHVLVLSAEQFLECESTDSAYVGALVNQTLDYAQKYSIGICAKL